MKAFSLATLFVVALAISQAHGQVGPGSVWENNRGSTLKITKVDANGRFEGEYINKAAGFGCKGTPFAVIGWMNNNTIGWTVNWKNASDNCKSVTSWSGAILSPTYIETIWSLGYTSTKYGPRVMTGSDYFTKK